MTSQVILSNSYGIAIASDSAVTTSDRVLNGVDKILPLQKPHKLAIAVSNNASFMDIPWESIIHKWSQGLPEALESLPMYWSNLLSWTETNLSSLDTVKVAEGNSILRLIRLIERDLYFERLVPFLRHTLAEKLEIFELNSLEAGTPSETLISRISTLLPLEEFTKITDIFESSGQESWESLGDELGDHFGQIVTTFLESRAAASGISFEVEFAQRWPHAASFAPYILEQATLKLSRLDCEYESVLCLAGYGANDLFPSIFKVSTYQMLGGLIQEANHASYPPGPYSQYLFLGQKDALENLMYGYDDTIERAFLDTEQRMFEIKDLVPADSTNLRDYLKNRADNTENRIRIQSRSLERPLYHLISSSPLKNLGQFAGSLVSIQAAFATITQPNPSVGGSIDIATIGLNSGFTWLHHDK